MRINKCQLCDAKNIKTIIDLGLHPLADTFLKSINQKENLYPLEVFLCQVCGYTGLLHIVPASERYQKTDYSYTSSNSPVALEHFKEMANQVIKIAKIKKGDLVVDIGSNVGTLLKEFKQQSSCNIMGVDPSPNIAKIALKDGVPTIQDFFNKRSVQKIIKKYGKAKAITCNNTFNHINDLNEFMKDVEGLLAEDGYFVFEAPYMLDLVRNLAFDTIYLEHVSYFSVKPFRSFFKKFGLHIQHLETNEYMGGSIRVYLSRRKENKIIIDKYLKQEIGAKIFDLAVYKKFMDKIKSMKLNLLIQIKKIRKTGNKIIGIGAATKGNTFLNYCKIDNSLIDFITDSSPLKIGKFTPGSHIPIKDDRDITKDINYALILPWNIAEFLKKKLKHLDLKFIVPKIKK
jgi:SAM-dependent methyltransferase